MNLHDQPIIQAHARHLSQHLRAERFFHVCICVACEHELKKIRAFAGGKISGLRRGMTVVRRRAAKFAKACPRRAECFQIAGPGRRIVSGLLAEVCNIFRESRELRIHDGIGPERRQNPPLPIRIANRLMIGQRIQRRIGRREHFQVESFVQRTRQKLRRAQFFRDGVEVQIRGCFREPLLHSKQFLKGEVQPQARWRSAKQVVMAGENAPDFPCVFQFRLPDLEIVKRAALAEEHAIDVMIGLYKKFGGIGERFVLREPRSLRVPVRTHDGQTAHAVVKFPGNFSCAGCGRKQSVRMDQHGSNSTVAVQSRRNLKPQT